MTREPGSRRRLARLEALWEAASELPPDQRDEHAPIARRGRRTSRRARVSARRAQSRRSILRSAPDVVAEQRSAAQAEQHRRTRRWMRHRVPAPIRCSAARSGHYQIEARLGAGRHGRRLPRDRSSSASYRGAQAAPHTETATIHARKSACSPRPAPRPRSTTRTSARSTSRRNGRATAVHRHGVTIRAKRSSNCCGGGRCRSPRRSTTRRRSPADSAPRTSAASSIATSSRPTSS